MNALFLFRMERILAVYARPYNRQNPVICYDERPCFLIGELVKGLEMKAEQVRREHYAYEKLGSCNLLATIEPLTGKRIVDVYDQRRKIEFAGHFQKVAAEFSEAEKITVILDNLNTHNESSFYEVFSAEEAKRLSDKFEFIYTPPKTSWLNIIEIEFSAISRLCLDRRIASKAELEKQVLAIVKEREKKAIKINWQFSIETAREKLNGHYKKVNPDNEEYLLT
ncbi:MAG: IS630 family transposase [Pyrinomonadaceae bacterium]